MKKYLIFLVLILSHFSVHSEGIKLSCAPKMPACENCPDYQTLFPIEEFSPNIGSLDIEADNSEIINDKYLLNGEVEVNSENLYLAADEVEVSSENNSILATGNVRFQDQSYLIKSDSLSATRTNDNLTANATNANYQDFGAGLGGANGYTEIISKTATSVLLTNATYSLCPVNKNDWLIDADQIELNLTKNRGVADNAIVKFYGLPIFYLPKYSWVLSGRGSGFLTPDFSRYTETGNEDSSYSVRVPYYLNLAPDRDLVVALNYMSSRGFIYESKYRQLIAKKITPEDEDSLWTLETKLLTEDKLTKLKRWLVNFSHELDLDTKTHFSAKYSRVSDPQYFKDISRSNTNESSLISHLKVTYEDEDNDLLMEVLTEHEQLVNGGSAAYTRALEGSASKTFYADSKFPVTASAVSTKFKHSNIEKESGVRSHNTLSVSHILAPTFPVITTTANFSSTHYSLNNNPNITRSILGGGASLALPFINKSKFFSSDVNHELTPQITYNYRAKKVQGNIPNFDTSDKYDDIMTFSDLTSGERYTGLDRITNANDFTISLESIHRKNNALDDDLDLINLGIAQSYYTDNEVVSDDEKLNYEARRSYSDIVASLAISIDKFLATTSVQYDPELSRITRKENSFSYIVNSRQFTSLSYSDDGSNKIGKLYASYPLNKSIHLFAGRDKTFTTGQKNMETSGIAYESCCWAFRVAHFKANDSGRYNYSTGMELVLTGLGSTSSPLKGKIEENIPGYTAKLR